MLQTIITLALVVERLVEWFVGTLFDKIPKLTPYKWLQMYVAGGLGIYLALTFNLDILTLTGLPLSTVGQVLTGIAIGGGANLIHDLGLFN